MRLRVAGYLGGKLYDSKLSFVFEGDFCLGWPPFPVPSLKLFASENRPYPQKRKACLPSTILQGLCYVHRVLIVLVVSMEVIVTIVIKLGELSPIYGTFLPTYLYRGERTSLDPIRTMSGHPCLYVKMANRRPKNITNLWGFSCDFWWVLYQGS